MLVQGHPLDNAVRLSFPTQISPVVNCTILTFGDIAGTPETGTPTLVNPSSTLLQDLLKEQRAHRGSRGPTSEDWNDNGPSTPEGARVQEDNASTASEKARKVNDVFSAGLRKPKEMGMREMDQVGSLGRTTG